MMKTLKLCLAIPFLILLWSCNDGDGRDETILDMSYLIEKEWYYNAWMGDKTGVKTNDLLDVVRFNKEGVLKAIDFSGRREYNIGEWTSDGNRIEMNYNNGTSSSWYVLRSGKDYIQAVVNEAGQREYHTDLPYLKKLTADAFLVNEYSKDGKYRTYVGADIRGNKDLREAKLLLSNEQTSDMVMREYYMSEKDKLARPSEEADEVRFYVRIGRDKHLKLRDSLYEQNIKKVTPEELNLNIQSLSGTLNVSWNAYEDEHVFCRVEVLPENGDITQPYFVSHIQHPESDYLKINSNTTSGEVNRMDQMKKGRNYLLRFSFVMYEPGVDPLNDSYGYANVQSVSYFTRHFVWE